MPRVCSCGPKGGVSIRTKKKRRYLTAKEKSKVKTRGNKLMFDKRYRSVKLPSLMKILKKFKKS